MLLSQGGGGGHTQGGWPGGAASSRRRSSVSSSSSSSKPCALSIATPCTLCKHGIPQDSMAAGPQLGGYNHSAHAVVVPIAQSASRTFERLPSYRLQPLPNAQLESPSREVLLDRGGGGYRGEAGFLRSLQGNIRRMPRRRKGVAEAMIREVVTVGTAAATVTAGGGHSVVLRVALATVTQVAVTAAVCYGAYLSPYAEQMRRKESEEELPLPIEIEGVDVTGYKVFLEPEVRRAIDYAQDAHAGQTRKTGEPYVTHCIHTAKILAALIPPQEGKRVIDTIIAGVLHDVVDDTGRDLRDVREHFGDEVAKLVAGVSKLSNINQLLRRQRRISSEGKVDDDGLSRAEVDDLRMMLLGMVNDPRVVLIKLADRLHNMRTIYALPQTKACAVAQETLAVWCSLASKLGEWAVKAELEDLCFAVLHPQSFRQLRAELAAIWSPPKNWRSLRRITKRAKRRAIMYGEPRQEQEPKDNPEDDEELSMKDLLEAVVPFEVLSDRKRRSWRLRAPGTTTKEKTKVVRDAEIALAALSACEEALERELFIATSYVPGMEVTLSGRLKSLYSTHCKMRRKGVGVDQIYDARALRVVVGDADGKLHVAAVEGCYNLLSVIHSLWMPVGGEFDDYIVNPKPSGYQSLHTAVQGPDGAPLEVQIRTTGMHDHAEFGHAAHWMYKEGDTAVKSTAPVGPASVPLHPPLGDDFLSDDEGDASEGRQSRYARPLHELQSRVPLPRRPVHVGHPALRIEEGRLLAAVVVGVSDEGRELLVAASFALHAREAVAAGRCGNQRKRWLTYCRLYKKVADQWWFAPGHGDWSTCLEKYTLCRDGLYHKQDQFDRSLPTFIQLLDLSEQEQQDYWKVMAMVEQGEEVDLFVGHDSDKRNDLTAGSSTTTRLNNKVKLLRSMLQWEQELRHEVAPDGSVTILNPDHPDSAALVEVLIIRWPDGEIMRMPAGSTAGDLARRMGMDGEIVFVNGQVALPHMKLKDGDLVETRLQVPSL